jgi:hypothetical protein
MCNGITNDCNLGTNYITPETNINNNKKSMCVTVVDSLPIDLSVTSSFDTTTANL